MIHRLVLLPGMHGTGELFCDFMAMFPATVGIQALHYPMDASPSYGQLLGAVKAIIPASEEYVLLAESFSTPLAIQFAATNPPNLKGLILCAGFATSPIHGWRKHFASLIAPLAFRLPLPEFAVSCFLLGTGAPKSLHAAVRGAIRAVNPTVLTSRLRQVLAVDARFELSQVSVPILVIQALRDRLVSQSSLEEMKGIKPQIDVEQIEGPHLILQREPQQSADIVAEFMNRLKWD